MSADMYIAFIALTIGVALLYADLKSDLNDLKELVRHKETKHE